MHSDFMSVLSLLQLPESALVPSDRTRAGRGAQWLFATAALFILAFHALQAYGGTALGIDSPRERFDWSLALEPSTGNVRVSCVCTSMKNGNTTIVFALPLTAANITLRSALFNVSGAHLEISGSSTRYYCYKIAFEFPSGKSVSLEYSWPDGILATSSGYILSYGEAFLPMNGPGTIRIKTPTEGFLFGSGVPGYETSFVNGTAILDKSIEKTVLLDPLLLGSADTLRIVLVHEETDYGLFILHSALRECALARRNIELLKTLFDRTAPIISAITGFHASQKINVSFVPYPELYYFDGHTSIGGGPIQIRYTILLREFNETSEEAIVLVHELAHALTPERKTDPIGYPSAWTEGVAEVISVKVLSDLGYARELTLRRNLEFSQIKREFANHAWQWTWLQLDPTISHNNYLVAYFMADYLVNNHGIGSITKFFDYIMVNRITFKPGDKDRFVAQLSWVVGSDLPAFQSTGEEIALMRECMALRRTIEEMLGQLSVDPFAKQLRYSLIVDTLGNATLLFDHAQYEESAKLLRDLNRKLAETQAGTELFHKVESGGLLSLIAAVAYSFYLRFNGSRKVNR